MKSNRAEQAAEALWQHYAGNCLTSWEKVNKETPWIADYYRGGAQVVLEANRVTSFAYEYAASRESGAAPELQEQLRISWTIIREASQHQQKRFTFHARSCATCKQGLEQEKFEPIPVCTEGHKILLPHWPLNAATQPSSTEPAKPEQGALLEKEITVADIVRWALIWVSVAIVVLCAALKQ